LVAEYWNETEDRLEIAADEGLPWSVPHFAEDALPSDPDFGSRASAWCQGFMLAVRAWPAAWRGATEHPDLQRHLATIAMIAGERDGPAGVAAPPDELAEVIGTAVLALRAALPRTDVEAPRVD
jgi:hypothetical protein